MAEVLESYTANIAQHFPVLIEYGNEGVYTEEEEAQLKSWLEMWEELHPNGRAVFSYGDEPFFYHKCDICGQGATCIEVTITILEK